jgi:Sec-independent protein translocase protein TatA
MTLAFFDFGFSEMLMVGVVALLVFGGNLPDVMRTLGQNYAKFRQTLREFSAPVRAELDRVTRLPPPEGIVRQMVNDANEEADEEEGDAPEGSEGFDDSPPPITSSKVDADEEQPAPEAPAKREDDLLDEGPLV